MNTLVRPLLTEKTLVLAGTGWYTFKVKKSARKESVSSEIENAYKVKITQARSVSMHGKARRFGKKQSPKLMPDWKKIMVRVAKGQTIDAFDVSAKEEAK
ncbi:50S ribosomal protein L23 [Candidatus Gottesmanbacteria bacterium]|nr:50S ribosomal protein L23 [Candidatus Gottesmanbacteria bacterium]